MSIFSYAVLSAIASLPSGIPILSIPARPPVVTRKDKTSIEVSRQTRNRLDAIGKRGETFDDIINRVLDDYKEKKK